MATQPLTQPRRFAGLDAVRALAALSIVAFHAIGVYAHGAAAGAAIRPWVSRLDVGVPVFFLLSGFLLYRPFVRARLDGAEPSLRAYAWRRALRVAPGYWVALLFAVLVLGTPGVLTATGIPRYFGFLQAYDSDSVAGGLPQAWTLSVEVAFYAALPLWAALVGRILGSGTLRGELRALAGLAAFALAWNTVALGLLPAHTTATEPWLISLPAFADMFALGMGVAVLSVRWQEAGGVPRRLLSTSWVWWAAALALFALAARGAGLENVDVHGFTATQALTRHVLYAAIGLCVLVPAVLDSGLPGRVLRAAPLAWLGRISYGIYLYHLTVLGLVGKWGLSDLEDSVHPYLLWGGAALIGSVLLAEASHWLVEAPALRLRKFGGPRLRLLRAGRAPAG